jgi:hypothetical protein
LAFCELAKAVKSHSWSTVVRRSEEEISEIRQGACKTTQVVVVEINSTPFAINLKARDVSKHEYRVESPKRHGNHASARSHVPMKSFKRLHRCL